MSVWEGFTVVGRVNSNTYFRCTRISKQNYAIFISLFFSMHISSRTRKLGYFLHIIITFYFYTFKQNLHITFIVLNKLKIKIIIKHILQKNKNVFCHEERVLLQKVKKNPDG